MLVYDHFAFGRRPSLEFSGHETSFALAMTGRTSSPAAGRGSGRGRRGRGRGRGRQPKNSPSAAPPAQEEAPDAAAHNQDAAADASDTNRAASQGSTADKKALEESGQPREADMGPVLDKQVQQVVVGGEAEDMVVKDAAPAQAAQPTQDAAVANVSEEEAENKSAEVKEQEVECGKAEDIEVKDDVAAQSANEKVVNKQDKECDPLNQGEMNAEQEEEDPEEVVFKEPVGEEQAIDEDQGEQDGARVEEDERMVISDMAKKRMLKKELEIFVGGLDRDAAEEDIRNAFRQVGEVVEVRLHKDFSTNKNKGFAFVKFASKEQVARALAEMKNPMIHGKRCGIAASEDNDTLFLGNICNTWTKEAINRRLHDYGIEGVENLTLVPDTQNEGKSRGFAFLDFSCHADAMLAFKRLQKPDVVFGHPERTAKVAFAEPIREPDPEVMAQVKSVFIDGLPPYWDEDRVKNRFKAYGEIERVVLARNMSSAKRNDFGFVNFTTHAAALVCIEATNNIELGDDGKSKVKVRVRLSNPLPKSQAVKGGMSGGFLIGYSGSGFNRSGRGFGRGRSFPCRAGFPGGRGFNNHAHSRGGRFNFAANNSSFEASSSEPRGRQAFGFRGGRWQPSGRHGSFDRGHGRGYPPSRRPVFDPEGDFGGPFGENPYFYADVGPGGKRPYSLMEPGPGYFEPGPPCVCPRPRFDHHDQPFSGGNRYRDSFGMGNAYSRDYYGPDPAPDQYGSGIFPPHYRGGHSGGRYY